MLVYDLADPRELVGEARGTLWGLDASQFTLARFLPRQEDATLEYRVTRETGGGLEAATYRAFDTESAIGRRPGVVRVRGELPPVSKKIPLTEYERLALEALGNSGNGAAAMVRAHYNDARRMATNVAARIELARGQALYDGKVTMNERGINLAVDFALPAEHRVAPAVLWSNTADAVPVDDMLLWLDTYLPSNNGRRPGLALTSTRVMQYLLRNEQFQRLARGEVTGDLLTNEGLRSVLAAFGLPPIEVYDQQITNHAGVTARVIPDDRFIWLPEPGGAAGSDAVVGETLFGVTAEALELAGEGYLTPSEVPGIVAVQHRTTSPVTRWTEAVAIALPVLRQPQRILTADVA